MSKDSFSFNPKNYVPECFIDNVIEEENKDIGFDLS